MRLTKRRAIHGLIGALSLAGATGALAGERTWDFNTDPTTELTIGGNGVNPGEWQQTGGNPGGFLALTWPVNSQVSMVKFPNIDPGKIVTAFKFEADLRVGNSVGERAADGFSVSFAREGDPALLDENITAGNQGVFAGTIAEGGSTTGIAVSFDTWSGNTYTEADGSTGTDIEGILVRVDNTTILRQALATRHGACDDATSLQTGPRDAAYWAGGGDFSDPASWAALCWQPFSVELDNAGKLTVKWKGRTILDGFQTTYFPTAGQLVLAGRTGNANEHTHFDNIKLTTTAVEGGAAPTPPGNPHVTNPGTRRLLVEWGASTVTGDPTARLAYEVEQDGVVVVGTQQTTSYEATGLTPGKSYTFRIRGKNVAGVASEWSTVTVSTVAEVDSLTHLVAQVYRTAPDGSALGGGGQADLDNAIGSSKYPNSPDSTYYTSGLTFGEPALGNTYGENHLVRIATVLTAPETGSFRFFIRSDDASRLYINTTGAAIPNPSTAVPVAQEDGCCGPFEEVGAGENVDSGTFPTSEPISLTAGQSYGILYLVKEGGGGDWGQVAWRKEGDTTPAGSLRPIQGALFQGKGDPVGGVVTINAQPASSTVAAYKSATFTVAATTSSPYPIQPVYQWYKNGAVIRGANNPSYNIPVVQPGDDGAKFKVLVSVVGKGVESSEATLTVSPQVAPKVAAITGSDSFTQLTVTFDQPVVAPSATTAANYAIDKGVTVSAATLVDQFNVRLTTSAQTDTTKYTLTLNNVQNLGGTPIAANTAVAFESWGLVSGRIRADQFTGFTGASLTDMETVVADPKYPNSPDVVRFLNNGLTFGEPAFGDTWGENHLVAIKGVLKPTETAQYRFFVRSDDASRLYINTSGAALPNAATATPIATEAGCCGGFEEVGNGGNGDDPATFPTSEPISLTAGQSYGILYLVKEGGGGDWGQVAWRKSTDTTAAGSLTPIKDDIYWYGPPAQGSTITNGLVAYWNFDGTLLDSIKDFHGTGRGTTPPAFDAGKAGFGQAIKLDGNDQFVEITGGNENELEFPGGSMSIAGWFKVDAFDTEWQAVIAKGEGSNYRVARRAATGTIAYAGGVGEGADDVPAVNDGQWHHFVAVSDASPTGAFGTAMYVDGVLRTVMASKPVLTANAANLMIGENPEARGREFEGLLDDIAIWNRVLTATEVATLYNSGAGTAISSLPGVNEPVPPVSVTVARAGANITIQWSPSGGTLETSPALGAGAVWTTVGTANPATVPVGTGNAYYRIRQ
jgi:hypothetical protein